LDYKISHVTAHMLVIAFGIVSLASLPISSYLARKLFKDKNKIT